jgi:hypothetical protein
VIPHPHLMRAVITAILATPEQTRWNLICEQELVRLFAENTAYISSR